MLNFDYVKIDQAGAAVEAFLNLPDARYLAGGTNLVDLMRDGAEAPRTVIDITGLPDMDAVAALPDGGVRIGALARNSDVATHPAVRSRFPVLSEALLAGASGQLRNMATVGGNLLQRTRCWYFVTPGYACNKRSRGSGCAAIPGINREHAILGGSDACIATHASDMCVALAALDATVVVLGQGGERRISFGDFHRLPGSTPDVETDLRRGDLITAVEIGGLPLAAQSHYLKLRDRASYQFALASAAVALNVREGRIHGARLALGGVGTKPWRAQAAEQALLGQPPTEAVFRDAADIALQGARTHGHNAFKVELAQGAVVRALMIVGGSA